MKNKNYIAVTAVAVFVLAAVIWGNVLFSDKGRSASKTDYLRIHIRANSNSTGDQSVKYLVKDEMIRFLTPLLADSRDSADAIVKIEKNIANIKNLAEKILVAGGYSYGVNADIRQEEFPTKIYGEYTLEQGVYSALIVELGEAAGDNWWCVAFPPLCFIPSEDDGSGMIKYKSKILEIIKNFFY
ncbi:MAG: stage II sporulation protein R [Clostridiales bacterium]|jgi:stage II sporulation protein R|nr:stage II sporulation protein R [Clostridiales bacterium]